MLGGVACLRCKQELYRRLGSKAGGPRHGLTRTRHGAVEPERDRHTLVARRSRSGGLGRRIHGDGSSCWTRDPVCRTPGARRCQHNRAPLLASMSSPGCSEVGGSSRRVRRKSRVFGAERIRSLGPGGCLHGSRGNCSDMRFRRRWTVPSGGILHGRSNCFGSGSTKTRFAERRRLGSGVLESGAIQVMILPCT